MKAGSASVGRPISTRPCSEQPDFFATRLAYSGTEEFWAAYPQMANYTYGFVLDEMAIAVQNLAPSTIKKYLGFDKRARSYICPNCYEYADRKLQREVMPHLAQLRPRGVGSKSLYCFV